MIARFIAQCTTWLSFPILLCTLGCKRQTCTFASPGSTSATFRLVAAEIKGTDEPDEAYSSEPLRFCRQSVPKISGRLRTTSEAEQGKLVGWYINHRDKVIDSGVGSSFSGRSLERAAPRADGFRVGFYCDENGNGAHDDPEPSIDTEQFVLVEETRTAQFTIARHADIPTAQAEALPILFDNELRNATTLLQRRHRQDDVRCCVKLTRTPDQQLPTFDKDLLEKKIPSVISSFADIERVLGVGADIRVVTKFDSFTTPSGPIEVYGYGREKRPGRPADFLEIVLPINPPLSGAAIAHEYGHTQGLKHVGGEYRIMAASGVAGDAVSVAECDALRFGGKRGAWIRCVDQYQGLCKINLCPKDPCPPPECDASTRMEKSTLCYAFEPAVEGEWCEAEGSVYCLPTGCVQNESRAPSQCFTNFRPPNIDRTLPCKCGGGAYTFVTFEGWVPADTACCDSTGECSTARPAPWNPSDPHCANSAPLISSMSSDFSSSTSMLP